MFKKGKMYVKGEFIPESKEKKPTVNGNIEKTKKQWFDNLSKKYEGNVMSEAEIMKNNKEYEKLYETA